MLLNMTHSKKHTLCKHMKMKKQKFQKTISLLCAKYSILSIKMLVIT